jgi:hypothetical protein
VSSAFRHRRSTTDHLAFAAALFVVVLAHAGLGFSVTWRPFLSAPVLLAGISLLVTSKHWNRTRLARA